MTVDGTSAKVNYAAPIPSAAVPAGLRTTNPEPAPAPPGAPAAPDDRHDSQQVASGAAAESIDIPEAVQEDEKGLGQQFLTASAEEQLVIARKLGQLGTPGAAQVLYELYKGIDIGGSENSPQKLALIKALGDSKTSLAAALLADIYSRTPDFTGDGRSAETAEVARLQKERQLAILAALGTSGTLAADRVLRQISAEIPKATGDSEYALLQQQKLKAAEAALGRIRIPAAVQNLLDQFYKTNDPDLTRQIIQQLGKIASPAEAQGMAAQALREIYLYGLGANDTSITQDAIAALRGNNSPHSLEALGMIVNAQALWCIGTGVERAQGGLGFRFVPVMVLRDVPQQDRQAANDALQRLGKRP